MQKKRNLAQFKQGSWTKQIMTGTVWKDLIASIVNKQCKHEHGYIRERAFFKLKTI